ncbi:class I SAM-dependent methyltransferase [Porticoccaceae bacterium LTM1]|nr:class I SAM-dependent methyltransferase [Porticoccaceae bacterium LTM1]
MSNRTLNLTDDLYQYLCKQSLRESELLKALRDETAKLPMARMQISPEQGQFMAMLTGILGARCTIEVGVFTGYSALVVAHELPDDGEIIACDISEEYTDIARRYWQTAGVADKIDLRLAPATETLQALLDSGRAGEFDFAFIDADKTNYQQYFDLCLELLKPGGVIAVDNVLWSGSVIDDSIQDEDTVAIRAFNAQLQSDSRVDISMLPVGDGLTLARKRGS